MTSSKVHAHTHKRLAGHTTDLKYCCHNTAWITARNRLLPQIPSDDYHVIFNLRPFQRCVQQIKNFVSQVRLTIYSHTGGMADQPELKAGHPPAGKFGFVRSVGELMVYTFLYRSEGWGHARGYQAQTWRGWSWCLRPEICRFSSRTSVSANSYTTSP